MTINTAPPAFHGATLRHYRTRAQLTVRQLASLIGVSAATVSAIENGKTEISVRRLQQFAQALSVPMTALLEDVADIEPDGSSGAADDPNWRTFDPLPIDALLTGAIAAFVETGYHGASMRSICQRANMSIAGAYHYYPSKQALLVAILELTMRDLIWRLEQARSEGNSANERLQLMVEALALFHMRRKDVAFIGVSELRSLEADNSRKIATLRDQVQHMLDETIADAAPQVGAAAQAKQSHVGNAVASMCTALSQWVDPDGPVSAESIAREHADFALRLLVEPPADNSAS